MLTSNNQHLGDFVTMHNNGIVDSSGPLSPSDRELFQRRSENFRVEEPSTAHSSNDSHFVLLAKGSIEASAPLSPSDRKLYFKRQSFGSPRLSISHAAEFPSDDWTALPPPMITI